MPEYSQSVSWSASVFSLIEQEIIRHSVNMCETPVLMQAVDKGFKLNTFALHGITYTSTAGLPKASLQNSIWPKISKVNGEFHLMN